MYENVPVVILRKEKKKKSVLNIIVSYFELVGNVVLRQFENVFQ